MSRFTRRGAGSAPIPWLLITLSAALLITLDRSAARDLHPASRQNPSTTAATADDEKVARAVCASCHKFSPPDILPRSSWRHEVAKMMFLRANEPQPRGDQSNVNLPSDMAAALRYMEAHAPERLEAPKSWPPVAESALKFTSYGLSLPDTPDNPGVSNIQLADFDGDGKVDVIGTEMYQGTVFGSPAAGKPARAYRGHPESRPRHARRCRRRRHEGSPHRRSGQFFPGDHKNGAVIWMRALGKGKFGGFWADGLPRVADVETADFNGDGKNDLAVAAFGWRTTGHIAILENQTDGAGGASFVPHIVDSRPGAIHIIPIDLNKDGKMDFVALIS
jgi:VCBS repeat protein